MNAKDRFGSYYSTKDHSFRNASWGYKKELFPSHDSVEEFVKNIEEFIKNGISEPRESYYQTDWNQKILMIYLTVLNILKYAQLTLIHFLKLNL